MTKYLSKAFLAPFAALVVFSMVLVSTSPIEAKIFDPKTFTLKNGMQVVVISNHRAPVVRQMVWYKVGSADEGEGESGIAHLLEHLMFKGTKTTESGEFSKKSRVMVGKRTPSRHTITRHTSRPLPKIGLKW